MSKPISIISNDHHIKDDNIEEKKDLFLQQCELAKEMKVDNICLLGDLFDSRKSQTQKVLCAVSDIFKMFKDNDLICHIIPGNHCKVNYGSDASYLDSFVHHPNINIYRDTTKVNIYGKYIYFVPFWEDNILVDKLSKIEDGGVIFSHFGTNKSINNDGSLHNTPITIESLKRFKLVLLGHFHQASKVSSNVYHLPSIQQNNYGEDNKKGFTIIYDDYSTSFVKSKFKEYITYTFDIDKASKKELDGFVAEYANSEDHIRVEVVGSQSKLKSLKREMFTSNGIDLKTKGKEVTEAIDSTITDEVVEFSAEKIKEKFKLFCEEKSYNYEEGKTYIDQKI